MGKDDPMAILTFIRGYGRKLDDEKNNMFRKIGIDNSEIYSLTYTDSKLIKIKKYIEDTLNLLSGRRDNADAWIKILDGIKDTNGVSIGKEDNGKPFSWRILIADGICKVEKVKEFS